MVNYEYWQNGDLKKDASHQIEEISWTPYGKVKMIRRTATSSQPDLEFTYDASGNRLSKIVKPRDGSGIKDENNWSYTYYTRDASGNVMAVYTRKLSHDGITVKDNYRLQEHHLYGSSRLGVEEKDVNLGEVNFAYSSTGNGFFTRAGSGTLIAGPVIAQPKRIAGDKAYELSNHLGNVLVAVSDKKLGVDADNAGIEKQAESYTANVMSSQDYYAFGAMMPNRGINSSAGYRYSFNGKENDRETVGTGQGTQDYGMRIYNPSLGRFLSVDPLTASYPMLTPYQFASNRPIDGIDLDGLEYLSAEEAHVEFKYGRLQIKIENFHNTNQNAWKAANANSANWAQGNIGLDPTLANVELYKPSTLEAKDIPGEHLPSYSQGHTEKGFKSEGSNRAGKREVARGQGITLPAGKGLVGKAATFVDAVNFGLEQYLNWAWNDDKDQLNSHIAVAQQVSNDMTNAFSHDMIPEKYQNQTDIVNIMNVILQGVNNSDNPEIFKIGMDIFNTMNPPLKEFVREIAPADATKTQQGGVPKFMGSEYDNEH